MKLNTTLDLLIVTLALQTKDADTLLDVMMDDEKAAPLINGMSSEQLGKRLDELASEITAAHPEL